MTKPDNFRDRVSTVDERGRRIWIYPKKPKGNYYQVRSWLSYFQLVILFAAPFISIGGKPLILLDVIQRKFVLFGVTFWPQDFLILGLVIIFLIVLIILFTTIYGRIWCGWLCPQTVFLEMLFRKIEYFIDGDFVEQKKLNAMPWNAGKLMRRIFKHTVYFSLSFLMGNIFLAYFIGSEKLWKIVTDPPGEHMVGLVLMILFSLMFYWLYAWFREQFCCFLCPYARLQSVLLDQNSIGVIYDIPRGEPRGRQKESKGDCIDCHLCQMVCPTGIDIRNGSPQLECVQCAACIDACDAVMVKKGKEKGLIKYASQNMIDNRKKFRITSRITIYSLIVISLSIVIAILIATRQDVDTTVIRNRGSVATIVGGQVMNLYNAKVLNKCDHEVRFKLRLDGQGQLEMPGGTRTIEAESHDNVTFFIKIPKEKVKKGKNEVQIQVLINGQVVETLTSTFLGI